MDAKLPLLSLCTTLDFVEGRKGNPAQAQSGLKALGLEGAAHKALQRRYIAHNIADHPKP